jgi:hypothetical protein
MARHVAIRVLCKWCRREMATPGQLVKAMAATLGLSEATVGQYDRVLAENGLRSKGGRGLSAARVTAADAANLLIAIMASPISGAAIKEAAHSCKLYGALTDREKADRDQRCQEFRTKGLVKLADLPPRHSFRDALVSLIEQAADDGMTNCPIPTGHVNVESPRPLAEIFADGPMDYYGLVYTSKRQPKKWSRGTLSQSRIVNLRTFWQLGATLQKGE